MGCVSQVGEQALNVGRVALLVAGWPETVCAATTDRQCGSSMQTAFSATAAIQAGHLDVVVAAGVENMSRVPMGSNLGPDGFAGFSEKLFERWEIVPQGISAEVLADEWNLSREALDAYSYESHGGRSRRSTRDGSSARSCPSRSSRPEHVGSRCRGRAGLRPAGAHAGRSPRERGSAMGEPRVPLRRRDAAARHVAREARRAPGVFKTDGVVTAGSSSQICDGAAAMLVVSEDAAERLELEPRARFVSFGLAGVDPYRMLHGNPQACERALAKAGLSWDDMAVIEVNEAFASVVLQFLADTGLEERWRAGDVNPNGGGISLGHPLGATGARITATLIAELERRDARYGIATMCIGQGQAIAGVIERL